MLFKLFKGFLKIFIIEKPKIYCHTCKKEICINTFCNKNCPNFPSEIPNDIL